MAVDTFQAKAKAKRAVAPPLRPGVYAAYRGTVEIDRASVPVKPVSQYKPAALYAGLCVNISTRQANAFRYIASCSGVGRIVAGETIPRFFSDADGIACVLENGCARDMLGAGLVTVTSDGDGSMPDTTLTLTPLGFAHLQANKLLGADPEPSETTS